MAQTLVICGGQRNGSTALLELLGSTGRMLNCGEILHASGVKPSDRSRELRLDPRTNFFAFAETRRHDLFSSLVNTRDMRREQWRAYTEHLQTVADRPWLGMNVKFASWHALDHVWQDVAYPPFLTRLFIESGGTQFVLINRRSVIRQALSERRAAEFNLWHASRGVGVREDFAPVDIDAPKLLKRARQWTIQSKRISQWLSPHGLESFDYEDLFDGSRLSDFGHGYFCKLLDIPPLDLPREPPLAKLPTARRGWIANAEEAAGFFVDTEFADQAPYILEQGYRDAAA